MSIRRMMFQQARTLSIQLSVLVLHKVDIIVIWWNTTSSRHDIEGTIAHVALINNKSLIFPCNNEDERMGEIRVQNMKTINKKVKHSNLIDQKSSS